MDFRNESFNFRSTDNDFKLRTFDYEKNCLFGEQPSGSLFSKTSNPVFVYPYNRRASWNETKLSKNSIETRKNFETKFLNTSKKDNNQKPENKKSFNPNLKQNLPKFSTSLYERACPEVQSCPMLLGKKSIKNALGELILLYSNIKLYKVQKYICIVSKQILKSGIF